VCDVIADAVVKGTSHNGPVNLAFGTRTSLMEVITNIEKILDTSLIRVHREERVGDVKHSQADNSILMSLFPKVVPVTLDEGLRVTVKWLRNYLGIK
jgi:UDP-glucose 4-epimerase